MFNGVTDETTDTFSSPATWFGLSITVLLLAAGLVAAGSASAGTTITVDDDGPSDYDSIQTAINNAASGDTIAIEPGTYDEALDVPTPDLAIRSTSGDVTVNATGLDTTIVDVQADDVTIEGLSLTIAGAPDERVTGVHVDGANAEILANEIAMDGGGCSPEDVAGAVCRDTPRSHGIDFGPAANAALIQGNTIAAGTVNTEDTTVGGLQGISAPPTGSTIADNTFQWWAGGGVYVTETDVSITRSDFTFNEEAIRLHPDADAVSIEEGTINQNNVGVAFSGTGTGDVSGPENAVLRHVTFDETNAVAVELEDGTRNLTVDARLNDFGVYDHDAVQARVLDSGDNDVRTVPFLLADGSPEPGLVRVQGEAPAYLSVQAALDAAGDGATVLVPASADPATPTPWTGAVDVAGANVTLCGTVGGGALCAGEIDPGHQQLSRAGWADAPGTGSGEAVLFDAVGTSDHRSTSYFPPEGTQLDAIDAFHFDYYLASGGCDDLDLGGQVAIDETPDNETDSRDSLVTITPDLSDDCRTGDWFQVDLFDHDVTWAYAGTSGSYDDVLGALPADYKIHATNVVQTDQATLGYVDNRVVGDVVLGERQDVACSGFGTSDEDTPCRQETATERAIVDGNGAELVAVDLTAEANGATLRDLTVQHTGKEGQGTGVLVNADDVSVLDNRLVGNLPNGSIDVWGDQEGLDIDNADDYHVAGNTIERWDNMGVILSGASAGNGVLTDNEIRFNTNHGLYVGGDAPDTTVEITDNDFGLHDASALRLYRVNRDLVVRGNDLSGAKNQAVLLSEHFDDETLDLRGNHWGVVREQAIRERITDAGDHHIQVVPYLDADGNQHPAPPEVRCSIGGTLTQVATTFSFQAAVDLDLPADCDDDARTVILHEGQEAYNGATIDTQVTLLSSVTGFTRHQTDGILAGGARIESNNHQTGIELVDGSQGSSIEGVSVQAEPVGATGIVVDVPGDDADITLEDVRVGTREHPASQGLLATDTNGVEVRSSVFVSGQPALAFENTADTHVHDTSITLSPASPDDPTRPAGAIRVTDGDGPRIHDNRIHGAQTPNSQAIALERVSQADVRDNLVEGAVVGLYIDASTGTAIEDNVVLTPTTTALTSATQGISIHQGADHTLARNMISGANTGLAVTSAPGVVANQTQMVGVGTGVQVQNLVAADGAAPQFEIHNARLATTATALDLASSTENLGIDAECNDWGVYHGDLIPTRITDDGTNNTVDYDPFTSADQNDPDAPCLTPPDAAFSFAPKDGVTRLDEVSFTDESDAGTRPIVEYRWDFGDGTYVNGTTEEAQKPTHSYSNVSDFTVVHEVEDADGMVSRAIDTIPVENIAPELDAIPNADVHHTETITREITASDAEGDNLTYHASPVGAETLPEGLAFDVDTPNDTATLDWSPAATQYGIYKVQVTADDQQPSNNLDSRVVTLEVDNAPPVFDPQLPDSVPGAVNRSLTLDVTARDPGPDQVENLTANLSQLPSSATFTTEGTSTGTLAWTPAPGDQGTYEVSFTATGPGRTTTDTVQLTIGDENLPPGLEITGETTVPETTNATLVAYANDTDSLEINWTTSSEPSLDADTTVEDTSEGEKLTWTARIPENLDSATVTFTADDGFDSVSTSQALTIQALPEGTARLPTEDSTGIQTANPIVGEPLTLRLDGEDPDGAVTSVTVYPEGTDGPAREMTETDPGVWTQDWTYTTEDGHAVTYTLTDDDGLTRNVTHHVAPLENTKPDVDVTPPLISGETEGPQGMEVTLSGFAQDPELRDLDAGNFTWSLPNGQTAGGRTVTAHIPVGVHTVTLAVEDPYGAVGTATATVEVDDNIAVDAEITNADSVTRSGIPRIEPSDHANKPINGTVTLTDDLGLGVGDGNVTLTVAYHGTRANQDAPLETHSVNVTTQPDGTATWSLEQDVAGALGTDQSVLSAPGYHEITVDANATSRSGAALDDTEQAQTTIAYWVGPVATGPNIVPLT